MFVHLSVLFNMLCGKTIRMVPEGVSWLMGAQGKPDKQDQSVGAICTLLCRKAKEAPEVFLHFFKHVFYMASISVLLMTNMILNDEYITVLRQMEAFCKKLIWTTLRD